VSEKDPLKSTRPPGERARLASLPGAASVVALGVGIGGPPAIQEILRPLRGPLPPILVVQQLEPTFQRGFVAWLDDATELNVRLAADGDQLLPGHVYVAPHQGHLLLTPSWQVRIDSSGTPCESKRRIDRMFESVAEHAGPQAVGVVLTGIGSDGAQGLLTMRARGCTTIAQTEESSVVYAMPRAAVDSGAARATASPAEIAAFLAFLTWTAPGPLSVSA
jgi:two-component system chemotaxis response regulator CheB